MTTLREALRAAFPEAAERACPKIAHRTQAEAAAHLARLTTGPNAHDPSGLEIYTCRQCSWLHVGHKRGAPMRITRAQAKVLAVHQEQLRAERDLLTAAFNALTRDITTCVDRYNAYVGIHNAHLQTVREFVTSVAAGLREAYDDGKGEAWQEGDAGQAAEAMVSEWEDADIEDVAKVDVLAPDPPLFEEGLNLPEESE